MVEDERKKLRIALLMDSFSQPRWVHKIIEDIHGSQFAEIVLIVIKNASNNQSRSLFQRVSLGVNKLLWALCSKLDNLALSPYPDPFEPIHIGQAAEDWPMVTVKPFLRGQEHHLSEKDISKIVSYDIHVALDFGDRRMAGAVRVSRDMASGRPVPLAMQSFAEARRGSGKSWEGNLQQSLHCALRRVRRDVKE